MPPRLGHKKSRLGCISCKRRRVKCDEQKPCGACVRYGWQCSLTNEPSSLLGLEPASNGSVARHATQQKPLPPAFEPSLLDSPVQGLSSGAGEQRNGRTAAQWLQDLELMHHFCVSTWKTMQHSKHSVDIWRNAVPRIASQEEYLMHGLLAVAALHQAHLDPPKQKHYYLVSTSHQNLAIAGFRASIVAVTRENADSIFLASILIASFAFASTVAKSGESPASFTVSDVADMLILIKGIEDTLSAGMTRQWVSEGPLAVLLQIPQGPPEDSLPDDQLIFLPHLQELHRLVERRAEEMPPHVVVSLGEALDQLDTTYDMMSWARPVKNSGFVMLWPNKLSMNFLSLLQERHPIALVILAYFCAMMHYHEARWVWETWGARTIELVTESLDPDWQKWVEWPVEIIEKDMKFQEPESWKASSVLLQQEHDEQEANEGGRPAT